MSLAAVLGRIPSGLYVLTTRMGSEETGLLTSWIMQAGFDPPMVTVALRRARYVSQWLSEGQAFVLNVLSSHQKGLIGHFGRGFERGEPAFDGLDLTRTEQGLPVILGCLGHLECTPASHLDSADHRIFLAHIVGGHLQTEEKPLVHIRKSGLHY
jgi:flavin reductase (DIM6/NTAB) family NADH-FMN oxidoreductase RutF